MNGLKNNSQTKKLTETEQEQLELDKVRKQLEKENLPSDLIDYGSFQKIRKVLGLVTVDKRKEKEYKKRVFPETEIAAYSDKASLYICAFDGEIYFRVSTKATPADLLKMLKKSKKQKMIMRSRRNKKRQLPSRNRKTCTNIEKFSRFKTILY